MFRDPNLPTIGVIGSYGSGKTSMLNLATFYAMQPTGYENAGFTGDVLLCRVEAWGRAKARFASSE